MPWWKLKAFAQKVISILPFSQVWNELFQTYVTRSLDLSEAGFESRLRHCRQHLDYDREFAAARSEPFTVFDLGTGWHPVVPIGLFLCGAHRVWTCDIVSNLKLRRVESVLDLFLRYHDQGKLQELLPEILPSRLQRLRDVRREGQYANPQQILNQLDITVLVTDARNTELPEGSIDLFVSVVVLEYIPRTILLQILHEFRRIGRPEALFSCSIDMADQYAYFDRSITPFNFLRYSQKQWTWYQNSIIPLNRLRVSDYRDIFQQAGMTILREDSTLGRPEDLQSVELAPEFRQYSVEDLLVLSSWFATRIDVRDG